MIQTLIYVSNLDICSKPWYMFRTLIYVPNRNVCSKPWYEFLTLICVPNPYIYSKPWYILQTFIYFPNLDIYFPNPDICSNPDLCPKRWYIHPYEIRKLQYSSRIIKKLLFLQTNHSDITIYNHRFIFRRILNSYIVL